ncbi:MAG: glycosyltransferase family 2 protein [Pseudomonadota bacterium]|nr:glycosyltransferase family 2 protein [Pseudomonadota bacterium]MDE3038421.1 glycosyltransferase family 2 protein [Pseudomonadota bacterium]
MQQCPVSVVIPCYRGINTIERAVSSVMAQTVLPMEIIIVEDCSSDENQTWTMLLSIREKHGEIIKLLRHEENQGAGPARNTGWNAAKGEYIALLDQDDAWHPQKLEIQYAFLKNHRDADLVGCPVKWLREEYLPDVVLPRFSKLQKLHILFANPFFTSSIVLKADIPLRFPKLAGAEDYYLWISLVCKNYIFYFCDVPLSFMFKPPFGVSGLGADIYFMSQKSREAFQMLREGGVLSNSEHTFLLLIDKLKMPIRKIRARRYRNLSKKD